MLARIRHSLLSTLQARSRPYDVRDTDLRGFVARVHPSGRITYLANYARGRTYTVGGADRLTPDEARAEAKRVLAKAALGGDPMAEKRERRAETLGEFIREHYAPWRKARSKWGAQALDNLKREFGDHYGRKLVEITPWIVEKWRSAALKDGRRPKTLNRHLDNLKSALARAVEWGLLPIHPLAKVKRLRVDQRGRVRYLDPDEETRLRTALVHRETLLRERRERFNAWRAARGFQTLPAHAGDHLRPLVLLALNTGLRRGELLTLRWADVDLSRRLLTVRGETAKSGQTRHVPLNSEALAIVETWKPADTPPDHLVFPGPKDGAMVQVNSSWRTLMKHAKVAGFRFHDLRHSFASKLVMAGVDLNTVRELLGHADFEMTLRYAHLAPQHKADAVEKLVQRRVAG